jgi:hypothetical protein
MLCLYVREFYFLVIIQNINGMRNLQPALSGIVIVYMLFGGAQLSFFI